MTIPPPRDEHELCARAAALTGLRLGDLAKTMNLRLDGDARQTKGTQGTLVERLLGAGGRAGAAHDFPALAIELKTVPVSPEGRPRESTFVCSFSLANADRAEWATSWARAKLSCVLWVPIITPAGAPMAERRVGTPLLWRPTPAQERELAADFDEIVGLIGAGHVEALTARTGRFLQARPKAAHSRVRTRAFGPDDEPMEALPRGLYLRAFFTAALLRDPAALPEPPAGRIGGRFGSPEATLEQGTKPKGSDMLRDVQDDDLPILFEHQWDPAAHRMAAFPPRERDAFLAHWRTRILAETTSCKRTIVVDESVVGNVVSWSDDGKRFVGYWIGREYWGRGIATAALRAFLREEPIRPLHAHVAVPNVGSIRVLEKCGFRRIGSSQMGADGVEEYHFLLET